MKSVFHSCGDKIIKTLLNLKKPIEVNYLVEKLKVNKTTVYRQIKKLIRNGILIEVEFGDGKKRYELVSTGHHHHLICKICDKLEDVSFDEGKIIGDIEKETNFKIESHNLEFFGVCSKCK